jgi:hypothetical protein
MDQFENKGLPDGELDELLASWKSPQVPARLRAALFPARPAPWWRAIWSISFRVPLPVACALGVLMAGGVWRWVSAPAPRVVIRTERVEVPVVKKEIVTQTVYRDRVVRLPSQDNNQLQPVAELRPRIIRRQNAEN